MLVEWAWQRQRRVLVCGGGEFCWIWWRQLVELAEIEYTEGGHILCWWNWFGSGVVFQFWVVLVLADLPETECV